MASYAPVPESATVAKSKVETPFAPMVCVMRLVDATAMAEATVQKPFVPVGPVP